MNNIYKDYSSRAAMTLLLAVLTTLTAWADPTIYIEPNYAGTVEVNNGTHIYVTANLGWNLVSVTWYENDPHGAHGEISGSSMPCSDSGIGYYTVPNSFGYVVVKFQDNWPCTVSKSEGSTVYDVLTISGTGAMHDVAKEDTPWWPYHETIKTLVINEGVTSVGARAFGSFTALTSVSLPSTVTSIKAFSFSNCISLMSVELPVNLTTINGNAFYGCTGLTSIDIPASVKTINGWAFYDCTSLASVTVHATTPPTLGNEAFYNNASGRKIIVPTASISDYKTADGWSNYAADILPIDWATVNQGTQDDPYMIYNKDQLDLLATRVNGGTTYSGKYFVLGADIEYSHTTDWDDATSTENNYTAIGYYDGTNYYYFKGTFDGQGHTVSGIRIYNTDQCQGLFGCIDGAVIRGITLADARITGYHGTSGIVGYSKGTISDCHVAADVTIHPVQNNACQCGGIVGNNQGTVSNCTSSATLTYTSDGSGYGGIAGNNDGTLSNNLAIGAVVPATLWSYYGAICGGSDDGKLSHNYYYGCTVAGNVNATGVGCKNANVTKNNGAVPGIVLYDNSSNTGINSYILTTVGNAADCRVELAGRTLYKDGDWNTLCLPFDVTVGSGQMEGATAMTMNASQSGFDASTGVLTLYFDEVDGGNTIAAGTPFIVKWTGNNVTNPVFQGVTITSTTPTAVEFDITNSNDKCKFVGQFSPFEIVASGATGDNQGNQNEIILLGSDNTLGYAALSSLPRTLRCFRAHFYVPASGGGNGVKAYKMNFGNESESTGIISLTEMNNEQGKVNNETDGWYDLSGRKLDGKPNAKGIYINNGRKVIIR